MSGLKARILAWREQRPGLYSWVQRLRYGKPWNTCRKSVRGRGNRIATRGAGLHRCKIEIRGDHNQVRIGTGAVLHDLVIRMLGNNLTLEVGAFVRVVGPATFWLQHDGGLLRIGEDTTMQEVHLAVTEDRRKLVIGRECMLSSGIDVRTGDSHSLLDRQSGRRINPGADVEIGDHVWIGARAVILKGARIGADSVVATAAVVTRAQGESGVIFAGNPARIVKEGVSWDRKLQATDGRA